MQPCHRLLTVFVVLAFGALLIAPKANRVAAAAAPHSALPLSAAYAQGFDSLAASGSGNPWGDDATIAGWYSSRTVYTAGTGSSTTGALYSFGSSGSNERALGSLATTTTGSILTGIRFVNDTATTVGSLSVRYVGEQWRTSGNPAQHRLDFSYQVGDTVPSLTAGIWADVDSLDFAGPVAGGAASALDGNDPTNRTPVAAEFAVQILPGQEIMLRWSDPDDSGSDHGLAIDDLEVTSAPLSVILEEFDAVSQSGHILVTWRTSSEFGCAGFNLYRGDSAVAPEALLGFIASQAPGGTQGASYAWQDFDVLPGQAVYYWLEEIDLTGATLLHGPVGTIYQAPTAVKLGTIRAGVPPDSAKTWLAIGLAVVLSLVGGLAGRRIRRLLAS